LESDSEQVKTNLLRITHWVMDEDRDYRIIWLERTALPFASLAEVTVANEEVVRKFAPYHHQWGIVVDMAQAPPRNDPAFEGAMRGLRAAIELTFARTAVLLGTQVGVLQVKRITREDSAKSYATVSREAALRFARGLAQGGSTASGRVRESTRARSAEPTPLRDLRARGEAGASQVPEASAALPGVGDGEVPR
jgi:hypothetical protein